MKDGLSISNKIEIVRDVKKKSFGFSAFTIVAVIVLLLGAVQPTLLTISKIATEIDEKKATNTLLDSKIDALSNLGKEYNTGVKDSIKDISLIFPSRGDFSLLMINIDEICKRNGFILSSINFDKPDSDLVQATNASYSVLQPWKVTANVKGNKSNYVKLMTELEKLPNYPTISNTGYANQVDNTGLTNFSIDMLIYRVEKADFFANN